MKSSCREQTTDCYVENERRSEQKCSAVREKTFKKRRLNKTDESPP
jgi:hypothetical protein